MAREESEEFEVIFVGEEDRNEEAVTFVYNELGDDETLVAVAGFDFETKVLAITDERVLITGGDDGAGSLVLSVDHDDISFMTRDGRTLIIETRLGEEHRFRFGEDETVEEIVEIVEAVVPAEEEEPETPQSGLEDGNKHSIAERVRFWEEQDKINQELIPRVIRQNELLTEHIAEHDNLPEVAGEAIGQALAGAREEQRQQYQAALKAAERQFAERAEVISQTLADAREEQRKQYQAALDMAKDELRNDAQVSLEQTLAALRQETDRTRNTHILIAAVIGIISITALIVSLVT